MAIDFNKWVKGRVAAKKQWTERLFSLQVEAPEVTFTAGQFGRLALPMDLGKGEEMVGRPYSFVNAPQASPHEFYFIVLDSGPLSPRLAALIPGDTVYLAPRASGFFSLSEVPPGDILWCLSTGTALGPFLSSLRTDEAWARYKHIVLAHAVRFANELTYRDVIAGIQVAHGTQFSYIPFVTREDFAGAIRSRIPEAIRDGRLEQLAGFALEPGSAQTMLCGNPDMVRDTITVLEERGLKKNRRREPGQITVETYW
jgi:ferredoxin--NADP+ reductase